MNLSRSITSQVTLSFAVLSAIVMISIGAIASYSIDIHFAEEDLQEINGKLELIQHALGKSASQEDWTGLPQQLHDALVGHHALKVVIYDRNGEELYRSTNTEIPNHVLGRQPVPYQTELSHLDTWSFDGKLYRGCIAQMSVDSAAHETFKVIIALDIANHDYFIRRFRQALWAYLFTGILFLTVIGWVVTHKGLRPVHDFGLISSRISASSLNERVDVQTLPRELVDLGTSFNNMLQRLQDSFQRLSDFSSDIAHELRTPVSNLMAQSQVALSRTRPIDEYKEVLYSNIEEYERLTRMISDMLFLAKADNGLIVPHMEEMELGHEADVVIEYYEALTSEKKIRVTRSGNALFKGDSLMIRRAFSNILSNAIRYTASYEEIQVSISCVDESQIIVQFDNPGEIIPTDTLERVFDRFYRVDPSRQRQTEGTGLGLPITKSIVEAHGGSIRAYIHQGLVRFEISLPYWKDFP